MTSKVEILIKGRNFLEKHKWGRGDFHNTKTGTYCAVGALWCGSFGPEYWELESTEKVYNSSLFDALFVAEQLLNQASPVGSLVSYNDRKTTEKADVILVFNKAIELAKSEEP